MADFGTSTGFEGPLRARSEVVTSERESANLTADIDVVNVPMPECIAVTCEGLSARLPVLKPRGDVIGKPNVVLSRDLLPGELTKKCRAVAAGASDAIEIMQYVGSSPCITSAKSMEESKALDGGSGAGAASAKNHDKGLKHLLK
jgi:hypothetical protein